MGAGAVGARRRGGAAGAGCSGRGAGAGAGGRGRGRGRGAGRALLPPARALPAEVDVAVVGAGLGGLVCAGLLARQGLSVAVLEAHTAPGGCAHSFRRGGFEFDSGPSFFAGLSGPPGTSSNPLRQALDLLGEEVECRNYAGWDCYLPEGRFRCSVRPGEYERELQRVGGPDAAAQFARLQAAMQPLARASEALGFAAFRSDLAAPLTLARGLADVGRSGIFNGGPFKAARLLNGPFGGIVDDAGITDPFLLNLLDLECFVLSGMTARDTLAPEMAFMYAERSKGDTALDYPVGGVGAIVDALVRGLERWGGTLHLASPVAGVEIEGGRASGVRLEGGGFVRARRAVVSNASGWDTERLVAPGSLAREPLHRRAGDLQPLDSFVHLHLGIDAAGLPEDLGIHHLVVNSWEGGVEAPRNVVNVSIPTALDPSLAPEGKAVIHAYYAANEPFADWKGLERGSPEYADLKAKRSEGLWEGLERIIPDVRQRAAGGVALVGSPLTHQHFNRRHRGSYGPGVRAGRQEWPTCKTGVPGLLQCGDSTFPGIGVPAVAGSGFIAANTVMPVWDHLKMLDEMEAMAV